MQKLGSYLDDLGDLVLGELVLDTFDRKLREKRAQAPPRQQTRTAVSRNLSRVQATLDGLMIDRPRRNLMRPNAASNRP